MLAGMLRRKVNGGKEGRPRTNCSFPSQFASAAQLSAELETALPTVRRIHVRREWICSGSLPFNQITAIRWSDPFVASWLAAASLEGAQEQHSTARPPNRQSPERSFLPITWCHASDTRAYYMAFKHERKMAFHVKRLTRKTSSEQSLRPGSHALKYTKVLSQCAISNSLNRTISLSSHLQL